MIKIAVKKLLYFMINMLILKTKRSDEYAKYQTNF